MKTLFFADHLALEKCCGCLFSDRVEAALNFSYYFFLEMEIKKRLLHCFDRQKFCKYLNFGIQIDLNDSFE